MLEEVKRGSPSRVYYRVNLDALNGAVDDYLASNDGGKRHPVAAESDNVVRPEPPDSDGGNGQCNSGYTSDETTEETTGVVSNIPWLQEWSRTHPHKRVR